MMYTDPFGYGDAPNPMKMYRGKNCEVKLLLGTIPQQLVTRKERAKE